MNISYSVIVIILNLKNLKYLLNILSNFILIIRSTNLIMNMN